MRAGGEPLLFDMPSSRLVSGITTILHCLASKNNKFEQLSWHNRSNIVVGFAHPDLFSVRRNKSGCTCKDAKSRENVKKNT